MKSVKKISVIIVDDEPLAREGLREILKEEKDISVVAESSDGEEAVRHIKKFNPDVVFLDIQMPEMNGFEVIRNIPANQLPLFIFVTAYDEFAIKAFTSNALDYVLKPFDAERIHSSLFRIREMLRLKEQANYSEQVLSALKSFQSPKKYVERISIRSLGKINFVSVDDILWIEADADYLHFHTKNGKHTTRETISGIEQQLDPSKFARIHRSYILNINCIRELQPQSHGEYIAILNQGTKLAVSRKFKSNLASFIN